MTRTLVELHLSLDAHESEEVAENTDSCFEVLGECRRGLFALGVLPLLAPFLTLAYRIRAAGHLGLVDDRLGLGRRVLLHEGDEHSGIFASDAQDVRRFSFFEDLVLHVGALFPE